MDKTEKTAEFSPHYRTFALLLLTLVYGFNFIDRQIVGILAPFIQADLGLTNTQLGLLIGLAFAFLYTIVGIPIAYFADRMNRRNIVAISLALWSGFTALIGEAGGSPPSHSIISDMYPKEKRAGALAVYSLGIPVGIMAAYFVGIGLAVIVRLVIREPRRGAQETSAHATIDPGKFSSNLKTLLSIPSWWFMCFGIAFASFSSYAFIGFQTKFIRLLDPEFDFRTVVIVLGIINGVAYTGGTFLGGLIADRWGKNNVSAYGWVPAIAICCATPFAVLAFWINTVPLHLMATTGLLTFLGMYLGPSFAIAQTLAPIHMRAMSTALFFFILNMIALGGGPTIAGILIDVFKSSGYAPLEATRLAMTTII